MTDPKSPDDLRAAAGNAAVPAVIGSNAQGFSSKTARETPPGTIIGVSAVAGAPRTKAVERAHTAR